MRVRGVNRGVTLQRLYGGGEEMRGEGGGGWDGSHKRSTFAITIDTLVTVQTELRQVNTQTLVNLFTVYRNNALSHFTIKRTALSTDHKKGESRYSTVKRKRYQCELYRIPKGRRINQRSGRIRKK